MKPSVNQDGWLNNSCRSSVSLLQPENVADSGLSGYCFFSFLNNIRHSTGKKTADPHSQHYSLAELYGVLCRNMWVEGVVIYQQMFYTRFISLRTKRNTSVLQDLQEW